MIRSIDLKIYVFFPLSRAYAWHILRDHPAGALTCAFYKMYFYAIHGYWPRFKDPRSFQEKLWSRMLFDRHPRWTLLTDKLLVRDYVAGRVGPECLIPLLWAGDSPEEIPFEKLPAKFVLKTNHGSGYNIFVTDKTRLNPLKAKRQLSKWLGRNFCLADGLGIQWGYKHIKPRVIVECLLEDRGKLPTDYKFLCYSGRAEFVKIDFDRFEDHKEVFLGRDLKPLDISGRGIKEYRGKIVLPENYDDMVKVAESLSAGIDFARVDLYSVGGRVYFGELTCYHGGGMIRLSPRRSDYILGEKWMYRVPGGP